MLETTINLSQDSENKQSHLMGDLIDGLHDLEAGIIQTNPRGSNKKMKKRKQLDALLKFRSSKSKTRTSSQMSNEALLTSEEELFLPRRKASLTRSHKTVFRRWCSYARHVLSFCLVCIFMIVCVGLSYANVELKHEVHNLSARVTEIEQRLSTFDVNTLLSTIDQIRTRLSVVEKWNMTYVYDRLQSLHNDFSRLRTNKNDKNVPVTEENDVSSQLRTIEQKSSRFVEVSDELDKLGREAEVQSTNVLHEKSKTFDRDLLKQLLDEERRNNADKDTAQISKSILSLNESLQDSIVKWNDQLKSLRNELLTLNQSLEKQQLTAHFEELTNLVHNSSDKTSVIFTAIQSDLDQIRNQIQACKCSQEPVHLKPTIVSTDDLKQSHISKIHADEVSSSSPITTGKTLASDDDQKQKHLDANNHDESIDIAQIVNPSPIGA